jgi:hypothetical protein
VLGHLVRQAVVPRRGVEGGGREHQPGPRRQAPPGARAHRAVSLGFFARDVFDAVTACEPLLAKQLALASKEHSACRGDACARGMGIEMQWVAARLLLACGLSTLVHVVTH